MKKYEAELDGILAGPLYSEMAFKAIRQILEQNPARVDYLVKKWKCASKNEKGILYLAILELIPLQECLEFGVNDDYLELENISDMEYPYVKEDGSFTPMSWDDYDKWLSQQKVIDELDDIR